jgi:FkbM family methyltransferase
MRSLPKRRTVFSSRLEPRDRNICRSAPAIGRSVGKVIAIEPNPEFCAAHRALGHDVLEYAASDTETDDANFFVVDSNGANYMGGGVSFESFSSLGINGQFADLHETVKASTNVKTISVKVRKLDTILATHEPDLRAIDILCVDVEGWELNVMRGLTLERYQPKIVILESVFNDPEYIAFMQARDYRLWRRLEPNDVYVRRGSRMRQMADRLATWPFLARRYSSVRQDA